jgi:hypothetical protein
MAAPVVSPVKRRRTAPAAPAQRAVTDVANVAAVHAAEPGSLIKIEAYMVFFIHFDEWQCEELRSRLYLCLGCSSAERLGR